MPDSLDSAAVESTLTDAFRKHNESPEELFAQVYQELKQVARAYMRGERPDHTLQATALVNEAYLRLFDGKPCQWENRKHLFCMVARSMRRVLCDHARRHGAERRGGGARNKVALDGVIPAVFKDLPLLLSIDEALERLATLSPRQAEVVDLHFFGGLNETETAKVLDVSLKTVKNDWRFAKAWLRTELEGEAHDTGTPRPDPGDL